MHFVSVSKSLLAYIQYNELNRTQIKCLLSTARSKYDRFAVQPGSTLTMPKQQLLHLTNNFIHLFFKSTKIKLTK